MAAELTDIWHVFQWRISIEYIDLDKGHQHTTFKFHGDISPFRMKTRSFNFAIFYGCLTYWDLTCFSKAHFCKKFDLIITKPENDLDIGHHHTTFKFHDDISQFIMKTRSLKFASPTSQTASMHICWKADGGSGRLKMTASPLGFHVVLMDWIKRIRTKALVT